jgi:hypothetical protein
MAAQLLDLANQGWNTFATAADGVESQVLTYLDPTGEVGKHTAVSSTAGKSSSSSNS